MLGPKRFRHPVCGPFCNCWIRFTMLVPWPELLHFEVYVCTDVCRAHSLSRMSFRASPFWARTLYRTHSSERVTNDRRKIYPTLSGWAVEGGGKFRENSTPDAMMLLCTAWPLSALPVSSFALDFPTFFPRSTESESERVHFFLATLGEDSGARTAAAARKGRPVLSKRQWLLFRPYTQRYASSPVRFRFHRFVFPILSYPTTDPSGQSHLLFAVVVRRGLALCSTAVQWFRALERRVGSEANLSQNPYRGRIPMWLPQYRKERIKTRTLALVASQCRNRVLASRASLTKTAHSHRLHRARSLPQASQRYTRDRDHVGVFRSGRRGIVRTVVLLIQNVHVADS